MTDPLDTNDDWADLAREFNLDKPSVPSPAPADEAVEPHRDTRAEEAAVSEGETEAEAADEEFEAEEAPEGEAGAEGEAPGTGRKRRRRRRRRRKGGAPVEGAAGETDADAAPEVEAETETDAEPAPVVAEESDGYAEDESEGTDAAPLAAEEDTASDVLRELIATWNVPSWGEIVDGLYRPH